MNCAICNNEAGTQTFFNYPICLDCYNRGMDYGNRRADRVERLRNRYSKITQSAAQTQRHAMSHIEHIPAGQPILVGHHSEGRHRNALKRHDRGMRKSIELSKQADATLRRLEHAERDGVISSDDPLAVIKLMDKIRKAQEELDYMKGMNKLVRKVAKPYKSDSLTGLGYGTEARAKAYQEDENKKRAHHATLPTFAPKLAALANISEAKALRLLTPDFAGRIGYPDYSITNLSANIRTMTKRLEDLKRKVVAPVKPNEVINGVKVVRDTEDNRLRLIFNGKPNDATIAELKRHGFKWSPTNGAWQRQLNGNAEYSAKYVLKWIADN